MSIKLDLQALYNSFIAFVKKDFHAASYIYTFTFALTCIFINYHFGFYRNVLVPSYAPGDSMWVYPIFYLFVYMGVAIPILLIQKDYKTLQNPWFYIKVIGFLALYGFATGFYKHYQWEFPMFNNIDKTYIQRCLSQLKMSLFVLTPIILMKIYVDKDVPGLYGLSRNTGHIKGYITLLLLLLPFLIATSFTPDFLRSYPQFCPWYYQDALGLPTWLYTAIFEIFYSFDFVMVELIFRGVLVIGMIKLMGSKAILPMVALYASIHFGKPILETFSSIFGGFILGALAYQTRHIWGGVIVHIGIALTMEIMGFIHYYCR